MATTGRGCELAAGSRSPRPGRSWSSSWASPACSLVSGSSSRLDRACTLCGRVEHGQSHYGLTPSLHSGFWTARSDGAPDPTEGRRLDRESHRWLDAAPNGRGWGDVRAWVRGALRWTASNRGALGSPRRPAANEFGDRRRSDPAPTVADDGGDLHGGGGRTDAHPGGRTGPTSGRRAKGNSGADSCRSGLGGRPGDRCKQWLQLRLLHLVGGAQAKRTVARQRGAVVVECALVRVRRRLGASHWRDHGDGVQRQLAAGPRRLRRERQPQRLVPGFGDELVGCAWRRLGPRRLPNRVVDGWRPRIHLLSLGRPRNSVLEKPPKGLLCPGNPE